MPDGLTTRADHQHRYLPGAQPQVRAHCSARRVRHADCRPSARTYAVPGMGLTTTAYFRDKLAMRHRGQARGHPGAGVYRHLNYDDLRAYMGSVPAPWVLKPRAEASAIGIRKLHDAEQVWRTLDELGDLQSNYLLETLRARRHLPRRRDHQRTPGRLLGGKPLRQAADAGDA
jgi:hypothetical protein